MCELSNYCYQAKGSKWLSEAAKRNNAIDYVDWVLSHPGRLELNRDIWASWRQRSGFRDRVSQTGTAPEKPGRFVSLALAHAGQGEIFLLCSTMLPKWDWETEILFVLYKTVHLTGDIVGLAQSSSPGLSELIASGVVSHVTQISVSIAYDGQHDTLLELDNSDHYKLVKLANDITYRRLLRLN